MGQIKKLVALALAVFVVAGVCGCKKNSGGQWLSDFDGAKELAVSQGKNILLLFSGDDWDGTSATLRSDILQSKQFMAAAADYVLVDVNFSQAEYAKTELPDGATDEQVAEAERIETLYVQKESIAETYALSAYPSLYVLSPEGFVISLVGYNPDTDTADSFTERLGSTQERQEQFSGLIQAVYESGGLSRVTAIDALYEATEPDFRSPLGVFVNEVLVLDPDNETGVIGKYEYLAANDRAMERAQYGDAEGASAEFEAVCQSGHLSAEQTQYAYYMAAYILAMTNEPDLDKMLDLLHHSYDAQPDSLIAQQVTGIIETIEQERAEQQEAQ